MTEPKPPEVPIVINDPLAPDIFADEATGFYLLGGNLRITFSAWRADHERTPSAANRVVICRLVMPVGQAETLVKGLGEFLERMQKSVDRAQPPAPDK
ncbi:MAG TPA: hypothetical protein VKV32_11440 [Stellaceae bacterium]|nr:hypothetical protein [Stellaceae bacterium]